MPSFTKQNKKMTISFSLYLLLIPLCQSFTFTPSPTATQCALPFRDEITRSPIRSSSSLKMSIGSGARKFKSFSNRKSAGAKLFGLSSRSPSNRSIKPISPLWIQNVIMRIKQTITILVAASVLFLGSASIRTAPSHASSAAVQSASVTQTTRLVSSTVSSSSEKLDKIIQKYVEDHMFDEEQFDPFESAYREAYGDQLSGSNPVKDILEKEGMVVEGPGGAIAGKSANFFTKLQNIPKGLTDSVVNWAEKNTSMDPKMVRLIMAVTNVAILPIAFLYSVLSFGGFFRKGIMRQEAKRYGDNKE